MRVGIIGCGNISETYFECQNLFNNFNIVACADINIEAAKNSAEKYNVQAFSVDNILANDVVCQSTFWACKSQKEVYGNEDKPILSVFTPTYITNERIFRTYESLVNQTYENWEWVVVDDSPLNENKTWE